MLYLYICLGKEGLTAYSVPEYVASIAEFPSLIGEFINRLMLHIIRIRQPKTGPILNRRPNMLQANPSFQLS